MKRTAKAPPDEHHAPKDVIIGSAIALVWIVAFGCGAYAAYTAVAGYYHEKSAEAQRA